MDTQEIKDLSRIVLETFERELSPGKLKKAIGKGELSKKDLETFDELFTQGVMNIATEWLATNFPSLSLFVPCRCGEDSCSGWKMKVREGQKKLMDTSRKRA